jgi:hypothetical protein
LRYRIFGPSPNWPGGWSALSLSGSPERGNNHTLLNSTLTVLTASGMISTTPLGDPHSFATCLPCADRDSSHLVSSKRVEGRTDPLRRGICGCKQSFPIHIRPIHSFAGGGCSFFPAADGFNPEGSLHLCKPTHEQYKYPFISTRVLLRAVLSTSLFKEPLDGC